MLSLIPTNLLLSWICIYACEDWRSLACGEGFNKQLRASATLISSYENIEQEPHKLAAINHEIKIIALSKMHFKTTTQKYT